MNRRAASSFRHWRSIMVVLAVACGALAANASAAPATVAAAPATAEESRNPCVTNLGGISSVSDTFWGPDGNLWWVEAPVAAIGRRTPEGVVTRFAAGLRDDDYLQSITVGPDGNLWFVASSQLAQRIGRITPAGVITMFTEGLTPGGRPRDITAGPDGNLWFTDTQKKQVGRITPGGVVTMFPFDAAGTAVPLAQGSVSITAGPDGAMYFTTAGGIGRITTAGVVTMFTQGLEMQRDPEGGPNGQFIRGTTLAITVGPDGQLWFTRQGSVQAPSLEHPWTVGKMTTTGQVTEVAEVPTATIGMALRTSLILDIVVGSDDNVWIGDFATSRLGRVTPGGQVAMYDVVLRDRNGVEVPEALAIPVGLSAGPDGAIWYGESGAAGRTLGVRTGIGRITTDGTHETVPLSTPVFSQQAGDLAPGPDGDLWYSDQFALNRVGADYQVTRVPGTDRVSGLTVTEDGDVWFGMRGPNVIAHLTPAGVLTTYTSGLPADFISTFFAVADDGNVWFLDRDQSRIGRITPQGEITIFSAGISTDAKLTAITAGADGNIWFSEGPNNKVGRITPEGTVTEFVVGPPDASDSAGALGITAGPDGNVWFSGYSVNAEFTEVTSQIGKITPAGIVTRYTEGLGDHQGQGLPAGIASAKGDLWVGFANRLDIARVTTSGDVTALIPATGTNVPAAGFGSPVPLGVSAPVRLVAAPDGSLWWSDQNPRWAVSHLSAEGDDFGDPCDPDEDDDGKLDAADNCVFTANPGQADTDGDGFGDACDTATTLAAPPTGNAGATISVTASVTGGTNPTGTVTFKLYGPNDPGCTNQARSTTGALGAIGEAAATVTAPNTPGTYRWIATYGGDQGNGGSATSCGAPGSVVTVKHPQQITFTSNPPVNANVRTIYRITATGGGSGNPVLFTSTTPTVCVIAPGPDRTPGSGNSIGFRRTGTCTIAANQAGNASYFAAPTVTQSFTAS